MFEVGSDKIDLQRLDIKDQDQFGRSPLIFNTQKIKINSGDLEDQDQRSLPTSDGLEDVIMVIRYGKKCAAQV